MLMFGFNMRGEIVLVARSVVALRTGIDFVFIMNSIFVIVQQSSLRARVLALVTGEFHKQMFGFHMRVEIVFVSSCEITLGTFIANALMNCFHMSVEGLLNIS